MLALALSLVPAGCASYGEPSAGFLNAEIGAAYRPLVSRDLFGLPHIGAAVMVAPHVAVTNAHNANLIADDAVLAQSRDYDLLFFRTGEPAAAPVGRAVPGMEVIAYGQGARGELREVRGLIHALDTPVGPRCAGCAAQQAVTFDASAGPGFSGGPLVDAKTGKVVGIVFGYRDGDPDAPGRRMFAYDMALVRAEMDRLLGAATR